MTDIVQQLRERGLKATPARIGVIRELGNAHLAWSHAEMEAIFSKMDRVTLYRILKDFEDAGLVHKIIDRQGLTRFALCNHACPTEHHIDDHVHFNCNVCHKMYCLDAVPAPVVKIPPGFESEGINLLIYGICKACNES